MENNPMSYQEGPWGQKSSFQKAAAEKVKKFKRPPAFLDGNPKGIVLLVLAVITGIWFMSGFYQINPDEQGLVLRFGKWVKTTEAGWHYHLPYPFEEVLRPQVTKTNQITIGGEGADDNLMLTGDRNIVDVNIIVQWHIKEAGDFLFNIRNPAHNIQAVTESVIREIIGKMPIDRTFAEGRAEIQQKARDRVQAILDQYKAGIQITEVNLAEVNPPQPVIEAFREVDRAYADQERMFNEAEGYRNDVVPKARGEASHIVQEATGYKENAITTAQGQTSYFLAQLKEYEKNPELLKKRLYYETMEKVLKDANKVLVSGKGAGQVLPHLKLPSINESVKQGTKDAV